MLSATAYTTHVVLDLFASDRYQWGLPLFWPLNDQAYLIPLPLFLSIRREADVTLFLPSLLQPHNVAAMIWEAVFMGAALLAVRRLLALPRPSSVTHAGETTEGAP
jgi:hypothetical protein